MVWTFYGNSVHLPKALYWMISVILLVIATAVAAAAPTTRFLYIVICLCCIWYLHIQLNGDKMCVWLTNDKTDKWLLTWRRIFVSRFVIRFQSIEYNWKILYERFFYYYGMARQVPSDKHSLASLFPSTLYKNNISRHSAFCAYHFWCHESCNNQCKSVINAFKIQNALFAVGNRMKVTIVIRPCQCDKLSNARLIHLQHCCTFGSHLLCI